MNNDEQKEVIKSTSRIIEPLYVDDDADKENPNTTSQVISLSSEPKSSLNSEISKLDPINNNNIISEGVTQSIDNLPKVIPLDSLDDQKNISSNVLINPILRIVLVIACALLTSIIFVLSIWIWWFIPRIIDDSVHAGAFIVFGIGFAIFMVILGTGPLIFSIIGLIMSIKANTSQKLHRSALFNLVISLTLIPACIILFSGALGLTSNTLLIIRFTELLLIFSFILCFVSSLILVSHKGIKSILLNVRLY